MKKSAMRQIVQLVIPLFTLMVLTLWSCGFPLKKGGEHAGYVAPLNEGIRNLVLTDMEKEVVRQLNDLRGNPGEWAARLKALKADSEEVNEAVLFLENRKSLPPLKVSKGLCLAAGELLADHGPKGLTGHKGGDGSTSFVRMNKYGQWDGKAGENLYYGYRDADRLMTGLLTEGGSQGWEQRNNIFSKDFSVVGIACGSHYVYRTMCVIDLAGSYMEIP